VANASHALRTPLARQRTLIEVALAEPRPSVAALQDVCRRVLATGEEQERLIEALLTLARSQRGLGRRDPDRPDRDHRGGSAGAPGPRRNSVG